MFCVHLYDKAYLKNFTHCWVIGTTIQLGTYSNERVIVDEHEYDSDYCAITSRLL